MSRKSALCLYPHLSNRSLFGTSRSLLCSGLVIASISLALPLLSRAQTVSVQPSSIPKTTVFLADSQLGVAGAYQSGGTTLYFEARTPEESTQMSARLLDAAGRTIATSGHSMDAQWLIDTHFDSVSATQSLSFAGALPAALASALDNAVFSREIALLSGLAAGAAQVSPGTKAVTIDEATADQTSVTESEREAARTIYEEAAAANLKSVRDGNGILSTTFHGTQILTLVQNYPDGENENNPTGVLGRTEVSAQILTSKGESLIQLFGGDDIPEGWSSDTKASLEPVDVIQVGINAGTAIRAAALMGRVASIATPDEVAAIGDLVTHLRNYGMFPIPDSEPAISLSASSESVANPSASAESSSSSCGNCFRTAIQVWNKGLAGVAQHSGTIVLHYDNNNPSRFPVLENTTLFCNHGTCPGNKPMNHAATCTGNWMGSYRNPPHEKITAAPPTPPSGYHSCYKTPYHLNGGFPFPWDHGHNCNDDTWTQIHAVLGKPYKITDGARCDDHALDPRSPGCND